MPIQHKFNFWHLTRLFVKYPVTRNIDCMGPAALVRDLKLLSMLGHTNVIKLN
jgi:hypothetical protein